MSGRVPYLGPETGDVLDTRELARELERLALKQSTTAITKRLPPFTGPATHPLISLARLEQQAAQAVTEAIPVVPPAAREYR